MPPEDCIRDCDIFWISTLICFRILRLVVKLQGNGIEVPNNYSELEHRHVTKMRAPLRAANQNIKKKKKKKNSVRTAVTLNIDE